MESRGFWQLQGLSDERLREGLTSLLGSSSRTEARIIAHLAELEERRMHLKEGSESLFAYCTRRLQLSDSEAFHRITAARIARRYPIVFELLDERVIHLSAVCLLRDYLTPENHRELLEQASHKTKREILELLARRFPRPDVVSRVRKLPARRKADAPRRVEDADLKPPDAEPSSLVVVRTPVEAELPHVAIALPPHESSDIAPFQTPPAPEQGRQREGLKLPSFEIGQGRSAPLQSPPAPLNGRRVHARGVGPGHCLSGASMVPLSEARYRIQLNAGVSLKEKLDRFRALISHSNRSGDLACAVERALELAIEVVEKRRFGAANRPRTSGPARTGTATETGTRTGTPTATATATATATVLQTNGLSGGTGLNGNSEHAPSAPPQVSALESSRRDYSSQPDANRRRRRESIPNATRREIVERDEFRCTYTGSSGERCEARAFLQVHHVQAWARGGSSDASNLRLLCAAHKALEAECEFGREFMALRGAPKGVLHDPNVDPDPERDKQHRRSIECIAAGTEPER